MLFNRYADPMTLLDQMIRTGRLLEFVKNFVKFRNEEIEGKTLWELWLHRVFDRDYSEFMSAINRYNNPETSVSNEEIENTVNASLDILNSFCPLN